MNTSTDGVITFTGTDESSIIFNSSSADQWKMFTDEETFIINYANTSTDIIVIDPTSNIQFSLGIEMDSNEIIGVSNLETAIIDSFPGQDLVVRRSGVLRLTLGTTTAAFTTAVTGTSFNGVALTTAGSATNFLNAAGSYVAVTASTVGLGNVTNESKTTMFTSPTFTGTPIAPTASPGTNTTQIATTAFVLANGGVTSDASNNTFGGTGALGSLTAGGTNNTAFGKDAANLITTGDDVTAIGFNALKSVTGTGNTAVGSGAGEDHTTAEFCALFGDFAGTGAGTGAVTGDNTVAIGSSSLPDLTTGENNISLGSNSGGTIDTGSHNMLLGSQSSTNSGSDSNKFIIHHGTGPEGGGLLMSGDFGTGALAITGAVTGASFNGVVLTTSGSATNFLNEQGNYVAAGGGVGLGDSPTWTGTHTFSLELNANGGIDSSGDLTLRRINVDKITIGNTQTTINGNIFLPNSAAATRFIQIASTNASGISQLDLTAQSSTGVNRILFNRGSQEFRIENSANLLRILANTSNTLLEFNGTTPASETIKSIIPFGLPPFAKASLPSVSVYANAMIIVTDDVGGLTPAFSDGTNWRRTSDRAIIA